MNNINENLKWIILARLLYPTKSGFTRSALINNLAPMVEHRWIGDNWTRQFEEIWQQLLEKGFVEENPKMSLTERGKTEILHYFGWDKKTTVLNWRSIKSKYLPARFLGLNPGSEEFKKRFKGPKTLRAESLRQFYDLKIPPMPTETEAINAMLSISEIGMYNQNQGELEKTLLRRMVDGSDLKQKKPPLSQPSPPPDKTFDLQTFAKKVLECARTCPTGWRGGNKVFISHVWRFFQKKYPEWRLNETEFKKKLTEANHQQLIILARADLVGVMVPDDVKESETKYLNDNFHFIRIGS